MNMSNSNLKIGLALSGGGVRAAVFHLGMLDRLAEESLLENVSRISTVSGGTLLMGLIYRSNNYKWPTSLEFRGNCIPYIKECLTRRNLQTNALLRMAFLPLYLQKGRASIISASIRDVWDINVNLQQLPDFPRWNINSTSIESGKSWRFVPCVRMGDYELNYVENPSISLADAMCSSAAVPLLIGTYKLKTKDYTWFRYDVNSNKHPFTPIYKTIRLWDGGAYDNLGIESLCKIDNGIQYKGGVNFLIVSDASLILRTEQRRWYNFIRLVDITTDQTRSYRTRILNDHFKVKANSGVYIQIGETIDYIAQKLGNVVKHRQNGLTKRRIQELRYYSTTLRRMEVEDFDDLMKHGREVTNANLAVGCPTIFKNVYS